MEQIGLSEVTAPQPTDRGWAQANKTIADRYEIVREIARGGMGVIYEGRNTFTCRTVALKLANADSLHSPLAKKRLLQEARALGNLRHPGIVEALDAGICRLEGPYLVMEKLEGRALDGILAARRTLGLEETLHVAKCVGRALAFAHDRGVVHRDVKPANIFVSYPKEDTDAIKLIDFGIAGMMDAPPSGNSSTRITKAGDVLGTLDYLSPEQLLHAETVDPRSDQYALAMVLYECLAGSVPTLSDRLAGPSRMLDLRKLVPGIPGHVVDSIHRALRPDAADRFSEVRDFVDSLLGRECVPPVPILAAQRANRAGEKVAVESRRQFRRAPYITPCRIIRDDGTHLDARSEDISEGGMLVTLPASYWSTSLPLSGSVTAQRPMERVRIRFALPTTGLVASLAGTVRWMRDGRGRAALGIEFEDVPSVVRSAIAMYVQHVSGE